MLSPLRGSGSVSLRHKAPAWADGGAYAVRGFRVPRAADVLSEVEGLVRPCDGSEDTVAVQHRDRGTRQRRGPGAAATAIAHG